MAQLLQSSTGRKGLLENANLTPLKVRLRHVSCLLVACCSCWHVSVMPPPPSHCRAAIKLGSQRLASIIKREAHLHAPDAPSSSGGAADSGTEQVVARLRATAADLGARAKEQGSRFYAASLKTAENIKRLTLGEPLQALCRSEAAARPCPQLALAVCTALVSGGGLSTQRLFKHNPPQELVDRLAESFSGPPALLPPAANPHALAGLLKQVRSRCVVWCGVERGDCCCWHGTLSDT